MIRSVDSIDRQEAIEQARAAAPAPQSATTPAAETSAPSLAEQVQAAASEAADLSSASNQLSQQWSAMVSTPASSGSPKSDSHEIKPGAPVVPAQPASVLSERDQALKSDGRLSEVRARLQAYQDGMPGTSYETEAGSYTVQPGAEERASYGAQFIDPVTGISGAEIAHLDQALAQDKQAMLTRERPASPNYGLTQQDLKLQDNPDLKAAQERFQAYRATMRPLGRASQALRDQQRADFDNAYVDPQSGIRGSEMAHLERAIQEKRQGDLAMNQLENYQVGSFTGNADISEVPATRAFTFVGHEQRVELMKDGSTPLGKAHMLSDGRLLLQDEHETGAWFLSRLTVDELQAYGVIDTNNGGLNIDGLYLNGSAHIGTSRPDGGIFGSALNFLGNILPGGKIGSLAGDAISDINQALNRPAREFLEALGQDKDDFSMQVLGHQEASVDVLAHASETGGKTYDELVKRTAEYDAVDRAANAVGKVMVASNIPIVNLIGAGIVVASGSMMAGHAQLQGQDANPNQGITDAIKAYYAGQLTAGVGEYASGVATGWVKGAGELAQYSQEVGTFASGLASNLATQAVTTGKVDLGAAFEAGALSLVSAASEIKGTSLNGVQLAQFSESVRRAENSGDWSEVASSLTTMIIAPYKKRTQTPPANDGVQDLRRSDNAIEAAARTDSEIPAPGPQSAGGPEASEPQSAPVVQRTPDAMDRTRLSEGSVATPGPDGSTVITRPDGTVTTISSNGNVRETRPDGSTANLLPNGVVVENRPNSRVPSIQSENFGQASTAARAANLGVFEWRGNLYNTGRDDQLTAAALAQVAGNPELTPADVADVRDALNRAQSRYAMGIVNNSGRANVTGFDAAAQDDEVGRVVAAAQQRNAEMRNQIAARFEALGASLGGQVPSAAPAANTSDDNTLLGALSTRGGNVLAHLVQGHQALVDLTSQGIQYVADNSLGQMARDYVNYQIRGGQAIVNAATEVGGRALDAGGRVLDYAARTSTGQMAQDFDQAVLQPLFAGGGSAGRSLLNYVNNTSGSQMLSDYLETYGRFLDSARGVAQGVSDTVLPLRSLYNTVERMGDAPPAPGEGVRNTQQLGLDLLGVVGFGLTGTGRRAVGEGLEVAGATASREAAEVASAQASGLLERAPLRTPEQLQRAQQLEEIGRQAEATTVNVPVRSLQNAGNASPETVARLQTLMDTTQNTPLMVERVQELEARVQARVAAQGGTPAQALEAELSAMEARHGFGPAIDLEPRLYGDQEWRDMLSGGRPFRDSFFGDVGEHGVNTHRMQYWAVMRDMEVNPAKWGSTNPVELLSTVGTSNIGSMNSLWVQMFDSFDTTSTASAVFFARYAHLFPGFGGKF